ncbi:MAG: ABC transporter ATP-binding protein [Oscillospiraceae bacterium]|nr:ABC transporter ATP-binding protein [Oscillospiraceae bacterium]
MSGKKIEVKNLSLCYHTDGEDTLVIENVSFNVYEKEFLTVIGPSGCGKSTLLSVISGILPPTSGHVYINGKPIDGHNPTVGYMLQKDHLLEWRSVEKNAFLGLEIKKNLTFENKEYVLSLLHKYGLGNFLKFYPSQISGGMRQKAALIRTLAIGPQILLLDEPFSALDFRTRILIADEIKEIISKEEKTAILVTHDIAEAISLSNRVVIFSKRPCSVKEVVEINMPEAKSVERRKDVNFNKYFEKIWKEIE